MDSPVFYELWLAEQVQGPYPLSHLRDLMRTGTIAAGTLCRAAGTEELWAPVGDLFAANPPPAPVQELKMRKAQPKPKENEGELAAIASVFMILVGVGVTLYYAFGYDTSVAGDLGSDSRYEHRVENIGRLNTRLVGVIIGLACILFGIMLRRPRSSAK